MIKSAVIGDPISHSLSPKIHNYFLKKYNISGDYRAIKVDSKNLEKEINNLVRLGYKGFNITIPHKESVIKFCDHLSNTAKMIGAVNTISILENNKIFGHNSDAQGFIDNIEFYYPDFEFKNKKIFVIGAGGAARAVIYALINKNVKKIFITNRNEIRVRNLINDFKNLAINKNCQIEFLTKDEFEKSLNDCDLLVNSSSLGMVGMPDLEINISNLNQNAIVNDIVYKPLMTNLLKSAQQNGNRIVTGIGMLFFQALIGFEMWFAKKAEFDNAEELIELCQKIK